MAARKPKPLESGEVPSKIRMLVSIASDKWSFAPQQVLTVGEDIDESTAAAWLEVGHAEEA